MLERVSVPPLKTSRANRAAFPIVPSLSDSLAEFVAWREMCQSFFYSVFGDPAAHASG